MLVDGIRMTPTGVAETFRLKDGSEFPNTPSNGLIFKLNATYLGKSPGIYYWSQTDNDWVALDSKAIKGSSDAIATLVNGILPVSQLPAIAITDTFVVSSEAAMLALECQTGDVAIRTDITTSFILKGTNASVLSDWSELLAPSGESGAAYYDIASSIIGKPESQENVLVFYTPRAFALAENLAGSIMRSEVAATASTVFSIRKNDVQFCTATFEAATVVATFSSVAATTFAPGDKLSILSPVQDATLADIHFSLAGTSM